jgi:hypothetical protein
MPLLAVTMAANPNPSQATRPVMGKLERIAALMD